MEGRHAILELFDLVFLVASGIDEEDELVFLRGLIVGDVEEDDDVLANDLIAFGDAQVFFQDDHPIGGFTFARPVGEGCDFFFDLFNVFKLPLGDDLPFDIVRFLAGLCFDLIFGRSFELFPGCFGHNWAISIRFG